MSVFVMSTLSVKEITMIGKKIVRKKSTLLYRQFLYDIKQAEKEINDFITQRCQEQVQPLHTGAYKGF